MHSAWDEPCAQCAAAVIGTTITTVIVFVPLAFVAGLVGDFFAALAGTLSAAVVIATAPLVGLVLLFERRIVSGLTRGAIKG